MNIINWSSPNLLLLGFVGLALPIVAKASAPEWFKEVPESKGNFLTVNCTGIGPDDLAYRQAMDSCRHLAAEQINGSFKSKSLSVETEKVDGSGFHQEVRSAYAVQGLACQIHRKAEDTLPDGGKQIWLQCRFDKTSSKVVPLDEEQSPKAADSKALIDNPDELIQLSESNDSGKGIIQGSSRHLIVTTNAPVSSFLVTGTRPRVIPASGNPQTLLIYAGDHAIEIRARHHIPKTIRINQRRSLSSEVEKVSVQLEKY